MRISYKIQTKKKKEEGWKGEREQDEVQEIQVEQMQEEEEQEDEEQEEEEEQGVEAFVGQCWSQYWRWKAIICLSALWNVVGIQSKAIH